MIEQSKLFLVILVTVVFFGCKRNNVDQPVDLKYLEGKWEIYEAQRDGKKTDLLSNGYIQFDESIIKHNLLGDEISIPYKIDGRSITSNDKLLDKVDILKMVSDSSILETTFKNFIFQFKLVRDEK